MKAKALTAGHNTFILVIGNNAAHKLKIKITLLYTSVDPNIGIVRVNVIVIVIMCCSHRNSPELCQPCFLEIFHAGPSKDRSTSICLSLVARPRVI